MNLEGYRTIFVIASAISILIAAAPTVSLIVPFSGVKEHFSEFWLLGPNHMAKNYPFNVRINETYRVFVGLSNHLGSSSYYVIYVKLGNQTEPLPNVTASEPSPLAPINEFHVFLADGETWENPLQFSVLEISLKDDYMFIDRLSINDVVFVVNASARWNAEYKGFYYQLFFELWLYNISSQNFQFHDRFVGLWLNMTIS